MSLVVAMLWLAAVIPSCVLTIFAVEVIAYFIPRSTLAIAQSTDSLAVLVPAHDEAPIIGKMLAALSLRDPSIRIVVIADNCSDDTAAIARASGVEVVERHDPLRRGKGFALAAGRDYLATNIERPPPICVAVLDADCLPVGNSLALLRDAVVAWQRPVQSTNLLQGTLSDPPLVQMSNFAFLIKNLVRQRGIAILGGSTILTGTGMAFPWPFFAQAALSTGNIVEDLGLAIEAARDGNPPAFLEAARFLSPPAAQEATIMQRTRWERGFIGTARKHAFPLIIEGIVRRKRSLFGLGLHLLVPPFALLIGTASVVLMAIIVIGAVIGDVAPAILLLSALLVACGCVFLAWLAVGRTTLAASTLWKLPAYVTWKIPLYLGSVSRQSIEWIRTPRR
ncbi:MAG: glycosyltransferase family 2 protein [Sphingomonas sp.]|nr:glycosyltransferase family 2 protein [Sphingomonas sp.]